MSKESACNAGDLDSVPGSGRSSGEENGNLIRYSCLGKPLDRGAWRPTDHGVAQSQTWLSEWAHTQVLIQAHWLYKANVPSVEEWWWLGWESCKCFGQRIHEKLMYFLLYFAVNLKLLKKDYELKKKTHSISIQNNMK